MNDADPEDERSRFSLARRTVVLGALTLPSAVGAHLHITTSKGEKAMEEQDLYNEPFSAFEGKSPGDILQELQDREEIRELISRYAHRVAHGVTTADLYTDDGVFIVRIPGRPAAETRGKDAIRNTARTSAQRGFKVEKPLPMIHNYIVKIRGDEAKGICSNELRMTENGKSMIGSGFYRDRYRRVNGRWWFVERDMTFIHWVPIQEGWAGGASGT